MKQWAKKRKESGSDEKDDASKASTSPPPAKKPKVADASKKNSSLIPFSGKGSKKPGDESDGSTTEEGTPEDDKIGDTIIVGGNDDAPKVKKVSGDPFGEVRFAHNAQKVARGASTSPSPAPRPERKSNPKPAVRDTTDMKFNAVPHANSQGAELARKPSFAPRAKGPAKMTPTTKAANGKNVMGKTPTSATQRNAKSAELVKNVHPQGKAVQITSKVSARMDKEKGRTTTPQEAGNTLSPEPKSGAFGAILGSDRADFPGVLVQAVGDRSELLDDAVENFMKSSAVSNQSTDHLGERRNERTDEPVPVASIKRTFEAMESDKPDLKLPVFEMANPHRGDVDTTDNAFTMGTGGLRKQSGAVEKYSNGMEGMSVSEGLLAPAYNNTLEISTQTASANLATPGSSSINNNYTPATSSPFSWTLQSHVFIITVSPDPKDISNDSESICLTFPLGSTTWSAFYGKVALELPTDDKAAFAGMTKCKVKLPEKDPGKFRVLSFGIMPPAAETIWAKVMRMVRGAGEGAEAVEVTFFN